MLAFRAGSQLRKLLTQVGHARARARQFSASFRHGRHGNLQPWIGVALQVGAVPRFNRDFFPRAFVRKGVRGETPRECKGLVTAIAARIAFSGFAALSNSASPSFCHFTKSIIVRPAAVVSHQDDRRDHPAASVPHCRKPLHVGHSQREASTSVPVTMRS